MTSSIRHSFKIENVELKPIGLKVEDTKLFDIKLVKDEEKLKFKDDALDAKASPARAPL